MAHPILTAARETFGRRRRITRADMREFLTLCHDKGLVDVANHWHDQGSDVNHAVACWMTPNPPKPGPRAAILETYALTIPALCILC